MFQKIMKRGISGLLVLLMVLAMLPASALAAETEEPVFVEGEYSNTVDDGHTHAITSVESIPALCEDPGRTNGTYCYLCGLVTRGYEVIPATGHNITQYPAKNPTYSGVGWLAYEDCSKCGYTTYVEIPKLETPVIEDYYTFLFYLMLLEDMAQAYVMENPGKDPIDLVIKYVRTGVDRYNSGSWGIMAGYEDPGFAQYVEMIEDMANAEAPTVEDMFALTSIKNIENFYLPNGDYVDIGHMFGTLDITYHNDFGMNHADVGGWAGDLVDLLEFSDYMGVSGTLDEMMAQIYETTFLQTAPEEVGGFNTQDLLGDLDAMFFAKLLKEEKYEYEIETKGLWAWMSAYFTEDLTLEDRAAFFIKYRMNGISTRDALREAVYNAYTTNKVVTTLEGTREFKSDDLETLRKAVCYCFADYICQLAGDYVESGKNDLYTVFSTETSVLAPGIIQQIKMATTSDGKQIAYYIATGDLTRGDVNLYANYKDNDPTGGWGMQRVEDQANAAEDRHSDPNSEHYIENYNPIVAVNGSGFNMATGQPSGLLVMEGVEYHPIDSGGFVGILKDGTPVIGTKEEYNTIYKGQVKEAIAVFGSRLIKDGKIVEGLSDDRASRTAIGFTRTGKVVLMVLDGRQEPFSAGGGYATLAQIMLEAGCVDAVNLDGGGSSTFVAQQVGSEELSVVNRPSDGYARSVSTSWVLVSTAPSSTTFDHAALESIYDYLSVGASVQMEAVGISPSGNPVDLPEDVSWAVSDESYGTITQAGVFTAYNYGDVDVYLMSGGQVVGSKTMHIVQPDNLYFTKSNLDMVFGETQNLPLKLMYQGKEMAFVESDVAFSLNTSKAGKVSNLSFTATENQNAGVSNVTVTAMLVCNSDMKASIIVSLYKQGELTFDFDQATGGDRQLAWFRNVTNADEDEKAVYIAKDPTQDMTVSYILAIDMTQVPIPSRLTELTYMLPGADQMENATAWAFLCNLAERISDLSYFTATVHYDPNMELDLSEMKLINDYFILQSVEDDKENSVLTLKLGWKKRSQAIDIKTANAMCIVNGLKMTPKADASWDSKGKLNVVNEGTISYRIYMRASALYSFGQKPENQQVFGLYSYMNPANSYDKGSYFEDTYRDFYDSFTLVNQLKEGWYQEEGGFAYYVAGVKHTGVKKVDGLYYNFGETGILAAKTPYSGLLQEDGKTYYAKLGETVVGWHNIGEDWYLFNWQNAYGENGTYVTTIDGVKVTYEFADGKLIKGFWYRDEIGLKYFYGPYLYNGGWKTIDGQEYFFKDYYAATGIYPVRAAHAKEPVWTLFSDTGARLGDAPDGLYWYNGNRYYVENASTCYSGLYVVDGAYYYANSDGTLKLNTVSWISYTRGIIPAGTYRFDAEGKIIMTTELVDENGTLYYYRNGARTANAGMVEYNGHIYLVGDGATVTKNVTRWVSKTNGLKPAGTYTFDAEGRLVVYNGIVDGVYYVDGVKTAAGLIYIDGSYYFAGNNGELKMGGTYWISRNNGLLPAGDYRFDAEGKIIMKTELVNENGTLYYYKDGKRTANAGLAMYEGDIYLVGANAMVTKNVTRWVNLTNGLKPAGEYTFDENGKMVIYQGVVDGYYYVDGVKTAAGLLYIDGVYYYAEAGGKLKANGSHWISRNLNGYLSAGTYLFGADGKIVMTPCLVEENGQNYYYQDGKRADNAGLVYIDGYYYLISAGAMPICNETRWVNRTNGLKPVGEYTFGADGKMVIYQGIVDGYYYVDGVKTAAGLLYIDGNYYYAEAGGKLKANGSHWISRNLYGMLTEGTYLFDAEGKIVMTPCLVEENGQKYYYQDGKRADNAGLVYIDGYYYLISAGAMPICNETRWISRTNGLKPAGEYTFGADGKMVIHNGIVNGYYYVDGVKTAAGLLYIDGNYYYAEAGGKLKANGSYWISRNLYGMLTEGTYLFDAEGKIVMEPCINNENGDLYYYKDGKRVDNAGLVYVDGNYYLISSGAKAICGETRWVSRTNGLMPAGEYTFGADGRMVL